MEFFCIMNLSFELQMFHHQIPDTELCPETTQVQFERNIEFIGMEQSQPLKIKSYYMLLSKKISNLLN